MQGIGFLGVQKIKRKSNDLLEEGVFGQQIGISLPIYPQIPLEILYRGMPRKHHQLVGRNSQKMKGGYRRPSRGVG